MPTAIDLYAPTLRSREQIAQGTMAFHLTKPADFQFRAGQSIDLTLIDPQETDAEGNTRAFSLASAPFEDEFIIATRLRDTAFKRVLRKRAVGHERQRVEWVHLFFIGRLRNPRCSWPVKLRSPLLKSTEIFSLRTEARRKHARVRCDRAGGGYNQLEADPCVRGRFR